MLQITDIIPENQSITTLIIKGPEVATFAQRKAGQFARISILRDGVWSEEHPFTISNAPQEEHLQMTIKSIGAFTSSLRFLRPGTEVRVRGPYGTFCKDIETNPSIVMLAGGIGVTPFLSVLRHFEAIRARNTITLFWANNTCSDIICRNDLARIAQQLNLTIVHVLWKESGPPADLQPFAQEVFASGLITVDLIQRHTDTTQAAAFLCGPPAMHSHVIQVLASLGIEEKSVHTEKFIYKAPTPAPSI